MGKLNNQLTYKTNDAMKLIAISVLGKLDQMTILILMKTVCLFRQITMNRGIVMVKITVNNEGIANKKPSDLAINIHANDPSRDSFLSNSSETAIKLDRSMYSVSESPVPGYNSSFSADCFGGIMSVETKKCIITNTYDKPYFLQSN
jgi:hypothetical protein